MEVQTMETVHLELHLYQYSVMFPQFSHVDLLCNSVSCEMNGNAATADILNQRQYNIALHYIYFNILNV